MQNNVFRLFQRTPLNICLHNMVATINKEFNYIIQRIWFNIPVWDAWNRATFES